MLQGGLLGAWRGTKVVALGHTTVANTVIHLDGIMAWQRQLGHRCCGAAACFHEFHHVLTVELVRQRMSSQKANETARARALEQSSQKEEWFIENVQTAQAKLIVDSNPLRAIRE